jgi:hypothetical protein
MKSHFLTLCPAQYAFSTKYGRISDVGIEKAEELQNFYRFFQYRRHDQKARMPAIFRMRAVAVI